MFDALCTLFIVYLTIRIMIKSGELMEQKGLTKKRKEPEKRAIFMVNILKIINNHIKK